MQAHEVKIHDIFIRNVLLYIPFFQRSYVWGEDDWRRLLDDLVDASRRDEPHFLGSVILKKEEFGQPNPNEWAGKSQVIDGQQRLTTLMIIMRIVSIMNGKFKTFDGIFFEDDDDMHELRLLHNMHDNDAFRYVMSLSKLKDVPEHLQGNIATAYDYFRQAITPEIAKALDVKRMVKLLDFVRITVEEGENEQQIFDSINSLGVRLTTAELLKNYLFDKKDIGIYEKTWLPVFERDDDTLAFWSQEIVLGRLKKASIDNFLYSFLQIKLNDGSVKLAASEKEDMQRYEKLFDSMKLLIDRAYGKDKLAILDELTGYARKYMDVIDLDVAAKPAPSDPGVERLMSIVVNLDVSTLVPYILYVLYTVDSEAERNAIFAVLEGYVMRRLVTRESNKNYNRFFTEQLIGNKVKDARRLAKILQKATASFPTDAELDAGFQSSQFRQHKQARGILYYLESRLWDGQMQSNTLQSFDAYSLEHMLPQSWRGTVWDEGVADGARRDAAMRTLGNMTIVTRKLNSGMRNSAWKVKVDAKGDKGLAHNARGLRTMTGVCTLPKWGERQIAKRAHILSDLAKQAWPYPGRG